MLVAAMVASLVAAVPAHAAKRKRPPKPVKVQLLAINDFHGHLQATTPGWISRTRERETRVPAGGAEYLATHVRRLSRRNRHTFVVAAGDLVGGSPLLSALFHDEPAIEAMNDIGLDIAAVGNHEFDEGAAELRRLQRGGCHPEDGCRDGTGFAGADFRYLAANVQWRRSGKTVFPPYAIRRVNGIRIAFIGMTLKGTPDLIPPQFAAPLRFRDEVTTANRLARGLRRRGVRAIVMLFHQGDVPKESEGLSIDACPELTGPLASIVRRTSDDIDLFITGHTHAVYNCVIDGRRVTSASSYGRMLTRIDLEISRRSGDVTRVKSDNWVVGQDVPRAPDISELIAHYSRFAAPIADRVVGRLARSAGRGRDGSGESRLGNLVADAQRASTGAAAAFVNPSILRASLPAGEVTYGRAFRSLPFGTSLVTQTMTGGQVRELLKQQWCGRKKRPQVLQVSSTVTYTWSRARAKAAANRPCSADTDPITDLRIGGVPVQPWHRFRVTVNTAMAGRDVKFSILHTGTDRVGGPLDVDSLADYLMPSATTAGMVPPEPNRINVVP